MVGKNTKAAKGSDESNRLKLLGQESLPQAILSASSTDGFSCDRGRRPACLLNILEQLQNASGGHTLDTLGSSLKR